MQTIMIFEFTWNSTRNDEQQKSLLSQKSFKGRQSSSSKELLINRELISLITVLATQMSSLEPRESIILIFLKTENLTPECLNGNNSTY